MNQNLSMKQQRVYEYLKAHVRERGYPPTVREIADALQLAGPNSAKKLLDVLERKGCIKRLPGRSRAIELPAGQAPSAIMVPVVGAIRAGLPELAFEDSGQTMPVDADFVRGRELFFLRVRGDSMTGAHIVDGDLALISRQPEVAQGQIAAVLMGDEATLKYFYKKEDCLRLEAANPAYKPIVVKKDEAAPVRILGRVIAVVRRMDR